MREIGFEAFDGVMKRHLSMNSDELITMCKRHTPVGLYGSNAYYVNPGLVPMEKKKTHVYGLPADPPEIRGKCNRLGADLIFDIDAKDLELPCRKDHTIVFCTECIESDCNHKKTKVSLPCELCISAARDEAKTVINILKQDFGINNVVPYFSGNEGFHIHVYDEQFKLLELKDRNEIADYFAFRGASAYAFGYTATAPPSKNNFGWKGRLASAYKQKELKDAKKAGLAEYQKLLEKAANKIKIRIDKNVTADMSRIFRMPGSLNAKAGLPKIRCDLNNVNPYDDFIWLGDNEIKMKTIPKECGAFKLNKTTFGPYTRETTLLPEYAAFWMNCKGIATPA